MQKQAPLIKGDFSGTLYSDDGTFKWVRIRPSLNMLGSPTNLYRKEYYDKPGRLGYHRLDGPAVLWYTDNELHEEEYFIDGNQLTKEEFLVLTKVNTSQDRKTISSLGQI